MSISLPALSLVDHHTVSISVDLGVTTPDTLRRIEFGLEKGPGDDNSAGRMIHFAFQTRVSGSDPCTTEVTLKIAAKTRDVDTEQAAETDGLSDAQVTALCQQHSARYDSDAGVMQVAGEDSEDFHTYPEAPDRSREVDLIQSKEQSHFHS